MMRWPRACTRGPSTTRRPAATRTTRPIAVAPVTASITDNDMAGFVVTPTSGLATTEAGGSATFSVRLTSQSVAEVILGLSSSDPTEGAVAPTSLTFTAGNWSSAQTVTMTGVDDFQVDGSVAYMIVTAAASSPDPNYSGLNPADVAVTNTDNDAAGVTIVESGGATQVTEGGATDHVYAGVDLATRGERGDHRQPGQSGRRQPGQPDVHVGQLERAPGGDGHGPSMMRWPRACTRGSSTTRRPAATRTTRRSPSPR